MADIAVIDYGMGNLRSVQQALRTVAPAASIILTDDPHQVAQAQRVVFPGQGAMRDCMRELDARQLRGAVVEAARTKPFLGICIGLQMLFERSAEGGIPGLGILPGQVVRFAHDLRDDQGNKLKVPHMGWNQVNRKDFPHPNPLPRGEGAMAAFSAGESPKVEHPLWQGIEQDARFYFVHSYYVQPQAQSYATLTQATSAYPRPFVCAVASKNIFAVQFHPEKSQHAGLILLKNFTQWNPV